MASPQPVFDQVVTGNGLVQQTLWVDLGLIPRDRYLMLGYATLIAEDKTCTFELCSNLQGFSDGNLSHVQMHDWSNAAGGTSVDRDMYQDGNIATLTVVSTGVEHVWLYISGHSGTNGAFDYILRYTTLGA